MTRAKILTEARTLFGRRGFNDASLREIAEAVGVKTPSLYAHFPSKEALYQAVYAEVVVEHTEFFDSLVRESADIPPLDRLRELLAGIAHYYRERPDLAEFSLRAAIEEQRPTGAALRDIFLASESRLVDGVRATFRDGVEQGVFEPGDPEAFTALVLVVMDGLFLQLTHYDEAVYEERFASAWTALSSALTAHSSTRHPQ